MNKKIYKIVVKELSTVEYYYGAKNEEEALDMYNDGDIPLDFVGIDNITQEIVSVKEDKDE